MTLPIPEEKPRNEFVDVSALFLNYVKRMTQAQIVFSGLDERNKNLTISFVISFDEAKKFADIEANKEAEEANE